MSINFGTIKERNEDIRILTATDSYNGLEESLSRFCTSILYL